MLKTVLPLPLTLTVAKCGDSEQRKRVGSSFKHPPSFFSGLPCRAGKRERESDPPYPSVPSETTSLSLADSNSYSNSLSNGSRREGVGQVSYAVEVAG